MGRSLLPGSPWENGYCESFNGKLREECLNGEIFYSLQEARIVIEQWRQQHNRVRPHATASSDNAIFFTSLGTKSRPGHRRAAVSAAG